MMASHGAIIDEPDTGGSNEWLRRTPDLVCGIAAQMLPASVYLLTTLPVNATHYLSGHFSPPCFSLDPLGLSLLAHQQQQVSNVSV